MAWHDALTKKLADKDKPQKESKYRNKRELRDGRSFQSRAEAAGYDYIKWLERAGKLKLLKCQDYMRLVDKENHETVIYIPDFKILNLETGQEEWFEVKGFETKKWPKVKKFWKKFGPGKLSIYKGNYYRSGEIKMVLVETILPEKFELK